MKQVIVVPYNPQWPAAFERAAGEVKEALGETLLAIHHIGSTSIRVAFLCEIAYP